MGEKKKRIIQIANRSEWGFAKFYPALEDPAIRNRFELVAVCGIERTFEEAVFEMERELKSRVKRGSKWRTGNRETESESEISLLHRLFSKSIRYFPVNGDCSLPQEAYDLADVVVIHSNNRSHPYYIQNALRQGKDVLCEKPLVPTIDEGGEPCRAALNKLVAGCSRYLNGTVLMDAEHYSYKTASLIFYESRERILKKRKITRVKGVISEIDDPDHQRTMDILNPSNGTGLMGDTMCHLLAFISNLGAVSVPVSREFSKYPDYHADTFDHVVFTVRKGGEYFAKGAEIDFTVAKFIDMLKKPKSKESKYIRFYLDDGSNIELDFRGGILTERKGRRKEEPSFRYFLHNNEYVNVLNHFYEAIINRTRPLTDFRNSFVTVDTILKAYELNSGCNEVDIYRTPRRKGK